MIFSKRKHLLILITWEVVEKLMFILSKKILFIIELNRLNNMKNQRPIVVEF